MRRLFTSMLAAAVIASSLCSPIGAQAAPAPAATALPAQPGWDQKVPLQVQLPPQVQSGGVINLSAFGWLEPYVDSVVQMAVLAGLGWFFKTKHGQGIDQASRDALTAFATNAASSLIADGAVSLHGKQIAISSEHMAAEVNSAATRIPDALKRFGITPDVLAAKIKDAIPQTPAGAAMIAATVQPAAPAA